MAFRNYILCFALVAGTIAGPINVQDGDTKCATTCEASLSDTGKFQYTPGQTYVYAYEGTTETKLQGSSEQTTSLKIQATADIEVISQCEFALKLSGVTLNENGVTSPSTTEFRRKLEASPLRFAFQDGKIENVCSESGEDERVLNVKRGVLSTFQNSMDQLEKDGLFTETDVSGTCPTTYTSKTGVFGGVTIMKSKDILACVDRTGNVSSIHSERYSIPSKLQNAPLLSSTHECEQDVKSGQIHKTTCAETLMFRPFSKDGSGAITKATQTLTYSTYRSSISSSESAIQKRSSMLFHHVYDESIDVNAKSDVIALLQEICTESTEGEVHNAPALFGDLVAKMKRLDTAKFMQVYTAVNGGRICTSLQGKQYFYDAIPMVATEASMALTKKLIVDNIVQGTEAEMWLTQLAFIPRPTVAMLTAVKPLLADATFRSKALLGISAMVHKICDNTPNCGSNAEIADFISMLNSNIGSDCSSRTAEERELIHVTLKALGNAGDAVTSSSVIGRCVTNQDIDTETRVIALQAYRRVPCSVSREDAMRIYQNAAHDSELRIHAFLAVMSCPSSLVLTKVRMMLSGEPVNQVGSFVWTYLENLKETASPLKQELSTILDDAKLREDFNLDVRKFSRNIEKSYFSDYLNAGAQIESNLIWSQKSYIPRSAMLNVTMEMFGNSINLVEFGGRVQGLEKIVEKFFGPNGYFSKKNTQQLMDNKRQTANYVSSFDNVFKTPDDKMTTSMYIKMFGNEIRFHELDSSEWSDIQSFNALDFLIKLAEPKKIDLTKNYQFIDSSIIVPTIVGLPMNLTVNGTISVHMDVDGNVDLRNIAASPRNFDISGHIKPSAAVVVSGMMGVDAMVTKSSMKMVASMHSSTQLDGKITLKDGEIFNVEMNTPQEKMEIFHVKTEFFMNGVEMTMPEPAKTYKKCTPTGVTRVIGMEMCVDVTMPTFYQTGLPLPPFTGPMNAQVFIEKKDTHTGYSFTAKYENERSSAAGATYTKRTVHVSLDTPGSQVDRKLLVEGIYDPATMAASASLMSPWKKFEWTTSLTNTIENKQALMTMKIDGTETYSADASLGVQEKPMKTTWTPSLVITVPNKPKMSVTGSFVSGNGKVMAAANLAIKNFTRKPITLVSSLNKIKGGKSFQLDVDLKSDAFNSNIGSTVTIGDGNYNGRASLSYTIQGRPEHRINMAGKFSDDSRGDLMKYAVQAGVIPTEFPDYQFNIDTNFQATSNHVDTTVSVELNKEKVTVAHKTTKQGNLQALQLTSSSSFKYPAKSIDISAEVTHEHDSNHIKSALSGSYAGQTVSSNINLDKSVADKYVAEAGLSYPGRTLSFESDVTKMIDGEHKMTMSTQWAADSDSKMSATASYKPGTTHEVTTDIKIPGHPMTLSATVKPNLMDFMARGDVTYKRDTYSLSGQYKVQANEITSSGSWVCPHRTMNYEVSASNQNGRMAASGEFQWDRDMSKKASVAVTYNNKDMTNTINRDASLTLTTPFGTQSLTSEFERTGATSGRAELEFTHNNERCKMSGRYSSGTGEFSIESPYIQYGPVKAISGRFTHADGHVDGQLTWAPGKTITSDVKWTPTKYSVDMTTPFSYERFGASVDMPVNARQSARAYWNNDEATFSMSYPSMQSGDFDLTYPGHTASGSFSQSGVLSKFVTEAEFNYDSQKYSTKVDFNGQGPITIEAEVNTPLAIKKISLDVNHRGPIMDFTNKATLTWDNQRIRSSIAFSPMQSRVVIKSPWKDVSGNYKVTGSRDNFSANTLMKWDSDKQIVGDVSFDLTNGVKVEFNAETPFYTKVSGQFEHNGSMTNCRDTVTLTWAPNKSITGTADFSMTNGLSLTANFAAPEGMTGAISVTHTGNLGKWNNRAEMTYGNQAPMVAYSEFDQNMNMKIGVSGMPCEKFQSGEMAFDLTKYTAKSNAVASITWNENQKVISRVMLSSENGYGFTASLTSPFTENYSAQMTWTGPTLTNFNHMMSVQWAPTKKITVTSELSDRSGYNGKIDVDSPWRQMSWTANQRGNSQEFNVGSVFSWETGKQISSTFEFSQISDIKATWTLKTPFDSARDMKLMLTHRGTTTQYLYTQIEGQYDGQTASVGTTWDIRQGAILKLVTVNPWKNLDANVKYTGTPLNFQTSADFTMDSQTYSTDLDFSFNNNLAITYNLKPVIYKPITVSVRGEGVTNVATLTWGDNKTINARANYNLNSAANSLTGDASFNTPFVGFESGQATFSFSGTMEAWRESIEVTFKSETAKLETEFSTFGKISGSTSLQSPWYDAEGSFEHDGGMNNFNNNARVTYAQGKTITVSSKWDMRSGIDSEFTLNAPFKRMDVNYKHQISASSGSASSEFNMDGKQVYKTDASMQNTNALINMDFSFTCPIKSFSGKYTHRGNMRTGCTAETEFTWDRTNKVSADWNVSLVNGFATEFDVKTPWKSFAGEVKHQGTLTRFENTLSATCSDSGKTAKLVTEFKMSPDFEIKSTLTSSWKNGNIMYRHSGAKENFQCRLEGAWETTPITANLSWNMMSGYELSFDATTPWKKLDGSFKTNTELSNLSSEAAFNWDTQRFASTMSFNNRSGYAGEATVTTPWRTMSSKFDFNGQPTNFDSTAALSWETGKSISAEASYRNRVATAKVNTPWRNLSANYRSTGPLNNFDSTTDFSWEAGKTITLEARSDITTGLDTEWKLTTPWRTMCVSAMYDMTYKMGGELSWETGKSVSVEASYVNRVGMAKVNTPWRNLSANYRSTGPLNNFDSTMDFSWETGKTITLETRADTRSGLDSEVKLTTPWRTLSADAKFDMVQFDLTANASWESGKAVGVVIDNTMSEGRYEVSARVTSPWKNLNTDVTFVGEPMKFTSTQEFSWEAGKTIKMETTFNMVDAMTAESRLETPWRTMSYKVSQSGDMTNFNGDYEVSWETGKKIASTVYMNRQNGWISKVTMDTPWRQMESNARFTGEMTSFNSEFDASWETGKKITTTASFDLTPLKATWTYSCPEHDELRAELQHTGTVTDFNNSAFVQWEPTKKIEVASSFKMADNIVGEASIKSPFSDDFEVDFRHTPTTGEMNLKTPYTETLKTEYNYSDRYNYNAKLTYGADVFTSEATTSWNNGMQMALKVTCPHHTYELTTDHQGTGYTFTNTLEMKYDSDFLKFTTNSDVNANTYSQTLETPVPEWQKMEWSANWALTENTVTSRFVVAKNNQKIEVDTEGEVTWKKVRSIFNKSIRVRTPFAGWADNKVTANMQYSARKVDLKFDGYKGTASNTMSFQFYNMITSTTTKRSIETYVKADYGQGESSVNFDMTLEGDRLTAEIKSDIKFAPSYNVEMSLDTTYSRTTSGLNHTGTLNVTCGNGPKKVEWNAGSTANTCETGFKYTNGGEAVVDYTHKTTWTNNYMKLDHDMTFKNSMDIKALEDCEFKVSYDFTQDKKTLSVTAFNDPMHPIDFKSELEMGDNMTAMVEMTTPWDAIKLVKSTVTVNMGSQPWTVRMESTLNQSTVTSEGRLSYTGPGQFDGSMTFTSQIPTLESLSFSVTNNKLNGQWKPHMVAQWASDKKIEMSGTFSWTNQYKASMDISTPFECCRSLITDITVNPELPSKLTTSFDFKTNKMSEKLAAEMTFDMPSKTFSFTMTSPFETMRSFEITSAATPRITAAIKLNGKTWFSVNGNGHFDSMYKHDLDVTMTYPFLNEFMRVKINNDISATSVSSEVDMEYMRGKEITYKVIYQPADSTTFSVTVTTPFEKFETMKYSVNWSGNPTSWTEATTTEFYYGKVFTRTTFNMANSVTFHQTITGEMKNGWQSFNLAKDLVFSGDMSNFDLTASVTGSMVPTMKLETKWNNSQMSGELKVTVHDYYFEYIHAGTISDFTCNWKLKDASDEVIGTWSFKNTNGVTFSVDIKNPDETNRFKFSLNGTLQRGTIEGMIKENSYSYNAKSDYSRTSSPFRYSASTEYWKENNGRRTENESFETSVLLTPDTFNYMWKYGGEKIFAVNAANPMNADDEYVPTITVDVLKEKYEFDGLYKNVGEGAVRDFKLHMNGPRGADQTMDFKFEIRTQSAQLVPGDMKLYLTTTSGNQAARKFVDMSASWGNDHALVTFVEPTPMRYSMDFSVSTTGQSGTIEANWDTSKADKNWKLIFNNKFTSSSRRTRSVLDMDLVYMGVSRGFNSNMDWQTENFSHKLTVDYNGKQIGYDVMCSETTGVSLEILTQWRNVKMTWNNTTASNKTDMALAFFWDSGRDLTKKFVGTSSWEMTATNTYKWTTTFAHPALVKDIVITDTIAYDTSRVYFAFNKVMSFSTDSSKDVTFDIILEKNGKWGVEMKQPFNKIDVRFGTEFTQTGTATTLKYMAANGRNKNFGLTTNYNPSNMAVTVELTTPMKNIKIETVATRTTYTISATVDGKTYTSAFTLRPSDYYMLIRLTGAASNMEFEAKRLDGGYQIQLAKIEGAKTTVEGRAAISMSENRTIKGDLRWNPALYTEIKSKLDSLRAEMKDTVKTMSAATTQEATKKMNRMSLGGDFDQIMPKHQAEMNLLQSDVNAAKLTVQRAYTSDVMYMKSIDEASQFYYSKIMSEFDMLQSRVTEYYTRVVEPMVVRLGQKTETVLLDLTNQLNKIEERLMALKTTAATKWNEQLDIVSQELEVVAAWLQTYIDRISEYVAAHPTMATLKSIHSTTMDTFNSYSDAAVTKVSAVASPEMYTNAIYGVHTSVNNALKSLETSTFDMTYLIGLSDSMMYKVKFYYDYYDIPDHVKNFAIHSKNVAAEYLNDYLNHYVDQMLNDFKWVAYDFNAGHVQFEMTIPTRMDNIDVLAIKTDFKQRLNRFVAHMSKYHWNLKEMFYMYKPRAFGQILPPFDAQAIIAGQHIRTFDRRHYDFASGSCQYLLARDFQDGNFTVFVNYANNEQSLTVHSNGKTIDIAQDYSVKMDGSKVELPVEFFNTTITRMGAKVVLTSTLGVEVTCDNVHGLCTVDMSGHYFAKTGGLFGTYNYEPSDDFTTSTNVNETSVQTFANSWKSRCTGTNTARTFTPVEGTKEYTACAALFKDSSSSLAPCFGIVKPENAFHKCINDMSNDVRLTATNGPCKAAKFYETECSMAGIDVMEPAQCVACEVGTSTITMGETAQLTSPVMAVDIVFVVEEKMCNYDIDNKLPPLAKLMERSLSRNAYTDMRFGLVGFGGAGVHRPNHVHTMASKMFATRSEFALGTNELRFSVDDTNKDVFSAIDFAAQYPFRAGASKVIVVLPCSDCSSSSLSERSIAARLNSENINVHVLNQFNFELTVTGKNPPTNYIFGIDGSSVYTLRDSKLFRGNPTLYSIVSKPEDSCSKIALSTGGTIFNQKMMTMMKASTIKSFQTVFANRLSASTTPSRCTSCSCEYNSVFGMSRSVCNKC